MIRRTARAKAPKSARWALGEGQNIVLPHSLLALRRPSHVSRLIREQPPGWFLRTWPDEMAAALDRAVRTLRAQRGPSPPTPGPGATSRPLHLRHLVGGVKPPFDRVFNRGPLPPRRRRHHFLPRPPSTGSTPNTGDPISIPQHAPAVIDVGSWDASRVVLAGGQSGNPLSPHYVTTWSPW